MVLLSPFDKETVEKMKACKRFEFPICLNESLLRMFGNDGKKRLDAIIMNETFQNSPINSPSDIWKLYEAYLDRAGNILGDDVGKVIEFESVKEMESLLCTKCPLFEKHFTK